MNRTNIRRAPAAIAWAAMCLAPMAAGAEASQPIVVESVDWSGTDSHRTVRIATSAEATYSVFRLSEPFRVLVDVNDAKSAKKTELVKVDDGMLRYVSTTQFEDEQTTVLRVEIALDEVEPYAVEQEPGAIVVHIGAQVGAPKATPVDNPVVSEPTRNTAKVGAFKRRLGKGKAVLRARVTKGDLSQVVAKTETLEAPRRLVVDLEGVSVRPKYQRVRVGRYGIKTARIADKGDSVRLVLDVARNAELPRLDVEAVKGKLQLIIRRAPKLAPVAKAPEVKAEPAPVVAAVVAPKKAEVKPEPAPVVAAAKPAPKPAPVVAPVVEKPAPVPVLAAAPAKNKNQVKDVRFEQKDGFVRLTVELVNPPNTVQDGENSAHDVPMLRLASVGIPNALERTLDVSELARGVLSSVSTYTDRGDLVVAAKIEEGTEHRHWKKDNRLMWDFRNGKAAQVLPYAAESTANFTSGGQAARSFAKSAVAARRYRGRRISLDLKDADILNVLRLLADVSKLNIVAGDDVSGKVTIKLRNVPWDQALDIILDARNLGKVRSGNIIRVAPKEQLVAERRAALEAAKARIELEPLTVRLIPVSYAVAVEVKPQVEALLTERGKVNVDTRTNVLIVEDINEVLLKVERLVRTLDTQTPQVLIEARIVEANSNFSRELGIQWGGAVAASQNFGTSTGLTFPNNVLIRGGAVDQNTNVSGIAANQIASNYAVNLPAASVGSGSGGALGFVFGSIGGAALINLRLSAAESVGKVKIISAPKVVTLDNKPAKIISGEKVPITVITANGPTTRFIDANLELLVLPHVTQDGSILLSVAAKKNEISNRVDGLGVPGIITKEAETQMIVRDGDTAVVGGIYRRIANENENYVPWLGKIPVLGWLFKNRTRTDSREELLIFISPRIVNRDAALLESS